MWPTRRYGLYVGTNEEREQDLYIQMNKQEKDQKTGIYNTIALLFNSAKNQPLKDRTLFVALIQSPNAGLIKNYMLILRLVRNIKTDKFTPKTFFVVSSIVS